jgi:hypothetical protein
MSKVPQESVCWKLNSPGNRTEIILETEDQYTEEKPLHFGNVLLMQTDEK